MIRCPKFNRQSLPVQLFWFINWQKMCIISVMPYLLLGKVYLLDASHSMFTVHSWYTPYCKLFYCDNFRWNNLEIIYLELFQYVKISNTDPKTIWSPLHISLVLNMIKGTPFYTQGVCVCGMNIFWQNEKAIEMLHTQTSMISRISEWAPWMRWMSSYR